MFLFGLFLGPIVFSVEFIGPLSTSIDLGLVIHTDRTEVNVLPAVL